MDLSHVRCRNAWSKPNLYKFYITDTEYGEAAAPRFLDVTIASHAAQVTFPKPTQKRRHTQIRRDVI